MSMPGTVFLVPKFAFSVIDHAILFYDLEHVCQRVSSSYNVQSRKGKLLSRARGEVMLYGYSSALKRIRFARLPIIAYLLLWR